MQSGNCRNADTHQLAILATKPSHALAGVAAICIKATALVQAWIVFTLVNVLFTVHAFVPTTKRRIICESIGKITPFSFPW
jgi:hypothetical protein